MVCVRIVQSSACSSCKIASYCNSAESKVKLIDVPCSDTGKYSVGQEVTVMAAASVGMKAVILAFVIPTVIIIATIVAALAFNASELTAAIAGMAILIPYYIILYSLRRKLTEVLTFYLKE